MIRLAALPTKPLFSRAVELSIVCVITLSPLFVSGCGTVATRYVFDEDPYSTKGLPEGRIYSGTRFDISGLPVENFGFFLLIDLPFSFIADTLFLPITIYEEVFREPLHRAAAKGDLDDVNRALDKGADIDVENLHGHTALMVTAWMGRYAVVESLLERGANVNMEHRKSGATSLMYAATKGYGNIVKALIEYNADTRALHDWGGTALILATRNGHADVALMLIEAGDDVNMANRAGWTTLMIAARNGHADIVKALLNKNAEINVMNRNGDIALSLAAANGHSEIIRLLKEASVK